jgi:hypothetical protein
VFSVSKRIAIAVLCLVSVRPTSARADEPMCGDFTQDAQVSASDALGILRTAVGGANCALWLCDVDENGAITASDALRTLQAAVGAPVALDCPVNPAFCVSDIDFFFANVWTPVLTDCVECHNPNGIASWTDHVLTPAGEPGYIEANFEAERAFAALSKEKDGAALLLSKPLGIDHAGGRRLDMSEGDPLHTNLRELIERFADPTPACPGATDDFYDGISYLDGPAVVRKAAVVFAGRLPTAEELMAAASGDERVLRETIRGLLDGPGFADFLRDGANDKFLTNNYLLSRNSPFSVLGGRRRYPALFDRIDEIEQTLGPEAGGDANNRTKSALAREPLELVVHVVTGERPYSEILTADYFMVNPWSAIPYQSNVAFDDDQDDEEWREGSNLGFRVPGYPHAGVLTSPMWLDRFPSTSTNRNRARARFVFDFFLGVDIEALASRAIDADALSDDDNPTMNNVHCTVCHEPMDPVAGAFQNFADTGEFRPDGVDALPDSYKDGELYQPGDLWYRDMRAPGFNNTDMPESENDGALAWLASQITNDPRFARGTVEFWFPAVFGQRPLDTPVELADANYMTRLAAWTAQDEILTEWAAKFSDGTAGTEDHGPFNLKDLFVEMALSPIFSASGVEAADANRDDELAEFGLARLLTPELLHRKLENTTGFRWARSETATPELLDRYRTFYGGIDSDALTERFTELNPLMSTVPQRMAYEVACPITIAEFSRPAEQRILFGAVEATDLPGEETADARIRKTIVDLHARLLGESIDENGAESDRTFALFTTIRDHRIANGRDPRFKRDYQCDLDFGSGLYITRDDDHTLRAWMAVLVYLLGDYEFLHE